MKRHFKLKTSHIILLTWLGVLIVATAVTFSLNLREYRRIEPRLNELAIMLYPGELKVVVTGHGIIRRAGRSPGFVNHDRKLPDFVVRGDTLFIDGNGILTYPEAQFIKMPEGKIPYALASGNREEN